MGKKKEEQDFLTRSMRKEKRGTVNQTPISDELNKHLSENILRKKAKQINREYKTKRILIKMASIISIFFLITYGALAISKKIGGNFEISLSNSRKLISLSETRDFAKKTDLLEAKIPESMNNISYTYIPVEAIKDTDGNFSDSNGVSKDYMGYTFYIKNVGTEALSYQVQLNILNFEKGLENCVRIIIIRNDDEYFYLAKEKEDGTPEQLYYYDAHAKFKEDVPTMTTPFESSEIGFKDIRQALQKDEIDRYTIIVWIEGSDPDTTDAKKSGIVKMNLQFNVIDNEGTTDKKVENSTPSEEDNNNEASN